MASSLLTVARPLLHSAPSPSLSSKARSPFSTPTSFATGSVFSRKNGLRVVSMAQKWEPAKVVPQADRVLVRLEELPEKSSGGVLLPKSAVKFERYIMGEILSVGADVGDVKAGEKEILGSEDRVLFSDINGYEVDLGSDAKHCFCRAGDLLAVVH